MKKIQLLLLSIFYTLGVLAQTLSLSGTLDDNSEYLDFETEIDFSKENALLTYQHIETFDIDVNLTINKVLVKNVITEELPSDLAQKIVQSSIPTTFLPNVHIATFRKKACGNC